MTFYMTYIISPYLAHLELHDNAFEDGILPGTLESLTRLKFLNLANTHRVGDLAAFDFSRMSAIQQINLGE